MPDLVPPVMFSAHPLALFRVTAPSTGACRSLSEEVQVGLLRVVRLPEDDQVTPAARKRLSA